MPLYDRKAQEALDGISAEEAEKYLEELRGSWEEIARALSRSTISYFLVVALFELLIGSKDDVEFTVVGFQFSNSMTLQKVLPALAGYLYFHSITQACRWLACEDVFGVFFKELRPHLYQCDLELIVKPAAGPWNVGTHYYGNGHISNLGYGMQVILGSLSLAVVPVAFAAQSSYLLIDKFGGTDVLSLVAVSLSGAFVVAGLVYAVLDRFGSSS
ncbi:hypothetical protein [Streptomyces sp. PRh5]|uniref:hypothetical protein n=1 Tax=Streptomyces sp. PRh5 TaxID=1158056 RepID=UPI0004B4766E|nr:hypothetical protein [Streptomyces sp. PRh5]